MDTAGIRDSEDVIESMGVEKSRKALDEADIVVLVLDGSRSLNDEELALLEETKTRNHLILANKTDLPSAWTAEEYEAVPFCAKTGEGRKELLTLLSQRLIGMHREDTLLLSNVRHFEQTVRALASIEQAQQTLQAGMEPDLAIIDINAAIEALGEITGETVSEAVTDRIFSRFCLGK
jgi:tRNA modification GTPase